MGIESYCARGLQEVRSKFRCSLRGGMTSMGPVFSSGRGVHRCAQHGTCAVLFECMAVMLCVREWPHFFSRLRSHVSWDGRHARARMPQAHFCHSSCLAFLGGLIPSDLQRILSIISQPNDASPYPHESWLSN